MAEKTRRIIAAMQELRGELVVVKKSGDPDEIHLCEYADDLIHQAMGYLWTYAQRAEETKS